MSANRNLEKAKRLRWGISMGEATKAFPILRTEGEFLILDAEEKPPLTRSRTTFRFVNGKLALMSYTALCSGQEQLAECFDLYRAWNESLVSQYGQPASRDFSAPSLMMVSNQYFRSIPEFGRAQHKKQWVTDDTIIVLTHDGLAPTPTLSMISAYRPLLGQLER